MILIVEDDPLVRDSVQAMLQALGYQAEAVSGAAEAIDLIRTQDDISLLFTDIQMPGIDGFSLADMAVTLRPKLRVIYASGFTPRLTEAAVRERAGTLHGRVIGKPYTLSILNEEIAKAMV